jgi:hypothetical protein
LDVGGVVVGQDLATAGCGLFNAGYFASYWWRGNGSRARRAGAAALTLAGLAAAVEAVLSEALFWSGGSLLAAVEGSPGLWALARLPLFLATLLVSGIIVKRLTA